MNTLIPISARRQRGAGRLRLRKLRYVEGRGDTTVIECTHVNPSRVQRTQGKEAARRLRQAAKRAGGSR